MPNNAYKLRMMIGQRSFEKLEAGSILYMSSGSIFGSAKELYQYLGKYEMEIEDVLTRCQFVGLVDTEYRLRTAIKVLNFEISQIEIYLRAIDSVYKNVWSRADSEGRKQPSSMLFQFFIAKDNNK